MPTTDSSAPVPGRGFGLGACTVLWIEFVGRLVNELLLVRLFTGCDGHIHVRLELDLGCNVVHWFLGLVLSRFRRLVVNVGSTCLIEFDSRLRLARQFCYRLARRQFTGRTRAECRHRRELVALDSGCLSGGGDDRFEVVKCVGDLASQALHVLLDGRDLVEKSGEDAPVVDALGQLTLFKVSGSGAKGQISLALAGRSLAQEVARARDVLLDQLIEGFVEREALSELLDLFSPMVRSVCVGVLVGGIGRIVHSGGLPFGAGGCGSCAVGRLLRARG